MEFSAEGFATREEDNVEEKVNPFISIVLEDDRVRYDTNMPVQDMVFWMEAVKSMLLAGISSGE